MKKKLFYYLHFLLVLGILTFALNASAQEIQAAPVTSKAPPQFRVVAYVLSQQVANGRLKDFDLSRINYLNILFNGVNARKKLNLAKGLDSLILHAHQKKVTVLASIGNAIDLSLITDSSRNEFADSLVASVVNLKLDGIDLDFEGRHINKDYEGFVGCLSAALKMKAKLLTGAFITVESTRLTDKALSYFDFLSIMSYNARTPSRKNESGQHSPYEMSVSDVNFWTTTRGIAKEKLNLGVPFYGYGFRPDTVKTYTYKQIVNLYTGSENNDQISVSPDNKIYYNGIATVKKKTAFALQNAGGIMIWKLTDDAEGEKSLLKAIDDTVNAANKER